MPNVSRRGFLQFLGATSAAPLLPLAPAKAAMATSSSTTSKALWASLYAKAGSQAKFIGMSRNMGLSNAAIQGVSARSIGVRVATSTLTQPIIKAPLERATQTSSKGLMRLRINIKETLEKYFWDDDDNHELAEQKSEGIQPEALGSGPIKRQIQSS